MFSFPVAASFRRPLGSWSSRHTLGHLAFPPKSRIVTNNSSHKKKEKIRISSHVTPNRNILCSV
uniref:Uncharacterized protein n=1 Tax=Anguilla anguilla TaxID=7936 RepID=A0A0E9XA00_ANGAN